MRLNPCLVLTMFRFFIGADFGQTIDYTALSVLKVYYPEDNETTVERFLRFGHSEEAKKERHYNVIHLERLPLGTSYPDQVDMLKELVEAIRSQLQVVDQTGVGRPVVDMLRDRGLEPVPVSIHGGDKEIHDGGYKVPKRNLVSILQILLQTKRIKVASSLKEADALVKEMQAFKVTLNKKGHDTYANDWRENKHDDLVLSVAIAAWQAEKNYLSFEELKRAVGLA